MPSMKKIILVATLVGVIIVFVILQLANNTSEAELVATVVIPTEDPLDVTLEFFNAWLSAAASTSTDPITADILTLPMVTTDVRNRITEAYISRTAEQPDPVLCQMNIPERIGGKLLYNLENVAEYLIFARGGETRSPLQSVVTLKAIDGVWQITDIRCVTGETAPDREFDFESKGFLLKSVQPPLNPEYWHLVYEQNGQLGYTVPLFFTDASLCVSSSGEESVCVPDTFTEASSVELKADMTEAGAEVKRLVF